MTDEAKRIVLMLRTHVDEVPVFKGGIVRKKYLKNKDCIAAADMIERLSAERDQWESKARAEAAKAEELQAELEAAKTSWIRVEDRLPDNDRPVITYDAAGLMWTEIYDYSRSKNLSLYERAYWTGHLPGDSPVTHWMPMPEPPKDSGLCAENGGAE